MHLLLVACQEPLVASFATNSGPEDPYVLFKSHRVIVGRREDFRRRTSTPTFAGMLFFRFTQVPLELVQQAFFQEV